MMTCILSTSEEYNDQYGYRRFTPIFHLFDVELYGLKAACHAPQFSEH